MEVFRYISQLLLWYVCEETEQTWTGHSKVANPGDGRCNTIQTTQGGFCMCSKRSKLGLTHANHIFHHWTTLPVHTADWLCISALTTVLHEGSWKCILPTLRQLPTTNVKSCLCGPFLKFITCDDFQFYWGMMGKTVCKWLHIFTRRNLGDQHTSHLMQSPVCVRACARVAIRRPTLLANSEPMVEHMKLIHVSHSSW